MAGPLIRDRLLKDVLGSIQDNTAGGWRILILDDFTTRIMSSTCKMSDIQVRKFIIGGPDFVFTGRRL